MATQVRKSRRLIEKAEKAADEAQKLSTVEVPPPPHAPARKPSASSTLVTKRKKSAPPQVKQKRKAEKDIDTELDSNNKKKKTKTTPKEKPQSAGKNAVVDEENQDGVNEPKPKRPRQTKKKADDTAPTSTALAAPPVNPSDPCSLFPLEIWHQILSCLPISQVAKISMVSKTWLDGCRTLSLWKHICIQNRYGQPKIKYKSYMAMVCARSYFVCEWCFSHTEGKRPKRSSNIPLVIEIKRKPLPPVLLKSFEHAIQASREESTEAIAQDSTEVAAEMSAQEATTASAQGATKEPSQGPTQKDSKLSQGQSQDQSDDQSDDQQLSMPAPSHPPPSCHQQQQSLDMQVSTQNQDGVLDAQKAATAIALILQSVTDQRAADDSTLQASCFTAMLVQGRTQPDVASVPSTATPNTASAHAPKADNPATNSTSPAEAKDNDKDKENDENKKDDDGLVTDRWMVCLECRQRYFKEHPESFHLESVAESHGGKHTPKITKTRAKGNFALTDDDMYSLPYDELENPHYRYAAPMTLFEQEDVQTLALDIHGGWVGIRAAKGSEARRRQLVYQTRSLAVLNRNPEKTGMKRKVVAAVKPEREVNSFRPRKRYSWRRRSYWGMGFRW